MSDGPDSNEPMSGVGRGPTAPSAEAAPRPPEAGSPRRAADRSVPTRSAAPRIVLILAALIVIGLPTAVGLSMVLSAPSPTAASSASESLGEAGTAGRVRAPEGEDVTAPGWVRAPWADAVPGMTAFELSSRDEVSFANGRFRPSLGISCASGQVDVHVTTGGTALIDPATSGHVVNLTFDQTGAQAQQWIAAHDQRALFAKDARSVAGRIAAARHLRFGFTHYLSGPVLVEFDLRGADELIQSMSEPCRWSDETSGR